jgi:hypothetical protein
VVESEHGSFLLLFFCSALPSLVPALVPLTLSPLASPHHTLRNLASPRLIALTPLWRCASFEERFSCPTPRISWGRSS